MSDFQPPPPDETKPTLSRADLAARHPGHWNGSAGGEVAMLRLAIEALRAQVRKLGGVPVR